MPRSSAAMSTRGKQPAASPGRNQSVAAALRRALLEVLRDWDHLTPAGGEIIQTLEKTLAAYSGVPHTLAVANATMAIEVALRAAGLGPGDEIVLPAVDWGAAAGAVLRLGAKPVFADVEPLTATLDATSLEACTSSRTAGVVVTHWAGCPANLDEILRLAQRRGLFVLEDCAQALGTLCHDRPVGSFGHAAVWSFGWGKLICAGEGGLVAFRDRDLWRRAVGLSQHPLRQLRERAMEVGDLALNARMHPLAAAMITSQWPIWPRRLERKRRVCLELSRRLSRVGGLMVPGDPPWGRHSFHRYVIGLPDEADASSLIRVLSAEGFPVFGSPVAEPLHLREPFRADYRPGDCPQAERYCRTSIVAAMGWLRVSPAYLRAFAAAVKREISALRRKPCLR